MSTRQTKSVDLDIYASVIDDIIAWNPDLQRHLDLDLVRMRQLCDVVGYQKFLMIDLPEAGKLLDQSLSQGSIPCEPFRSLPGWPTRDSLFDCLLSLVFNFEDIDAIVYEGRVPIRKEPDINAIFFLRQLLYMAKKLKVQCPVEATENAVHEFCLIEEELRAPSLPWYEGEWHEEDVFKSVEREFKWHTVSTVPFEPLSFTDAVSEDLYWSGDSNLLENLWILDKVSRVVSAGFPEVDLHGLHPKHGPGAVADGSIRSATFDKFEFPTWPDRLQRSFTFEFYGQTREDLHLEGNIHEPARKAARSRLLAVTKTYKGPRLIDAVPTSNQFLQQGFGRWMKDNIPSCLKPCLDFWSQIPSRKACLKASITGKDATVDLESASDRYSLWAVERFYATRPDILSVLYAVRTAEQDITAVASEDTIEEFGEYLTLKKYASQGSGVTFPLQSVAYAIIAVAAVISADTLRSGGCLNTTKITERRVKSAAKKCRVFGDDIIIPAYAVPVLEMLLETLQLRMSKTKSHTTGKFRESCGMDAYDGHDVTPIYLSHLNFSMSSHCKRLMATKRLSPKALSMVKPGRLSSWIDVSNNAYRAGLLNLAQHMDDQLPQTLRKYLPEWEKELGCYTRICRSGSRTQLSATYDRELQNWLIRGITISDQSVMAMRDEYVALLCYFYNAGEQERSGLELSYLDPQSFDATARLVQSQSRLELGRVPVSFR